MTETADPTTFTVGEGEDLITYDVRGDLAAGGRPPLFLFGSPMDAVGFGSLAPHLADRPIVTYDPRGAGRNPTATGTMTPQQHAEDLHRVIEALGVGPVDCFGTSGGAVNLLELARAFPEDVRVAVAHEPPTVVDLPDHEPMLAACRDLRETYESSGQGPAMAKFIALVMTTGELPADYLDQPAPEPAQFGLPTEDDGDRSNPLFRNGPACNEYEVDADALATFGDRLVIGVGTESAEQMPGRCGRAVATRLGREPVVFPGGHNGFSGGEYNQPAGDPRGFAAVLTSVLDRPER